MTLWAERHAWQACAQRQGALVCWKPVVPQASLHTVPRSITLAEALLAVKECKEKAPELCLSTQEFPRLPCLQAEQGAVGLSAAAAGTGWRRGPPAASAHVLVLLAH